MADCIFCKIAAKEIPGTVVFENDDVLAFRDIDGKAPTHVLVIPKKHITSVDALGREDDALLGSFFEAIRKVAAAEGLGKGYRVVSNVGADGGQSVDHLHFHLLGGRQMAWPPG